MPYSDHENYHASIDDGRGEWPSDSTVPKSTSPPKEYENYHAGIDDNMQFMQPSSANDAQRNIAASNHEHSGDAGRQNHNFKVTALGTIEYRPPPKLPKFVIRDKSGKIHEPSVASKTNGRGGATASLKQVGKVLIAQDVKESEPRLQRQNNHETENEAPKPEAMDADGLDENQKANKKKKSDKKSQKPNTKQGKGGFATPIDVPNNDEVASAKGRPVGNADTTGNRGNSKKKKKDKRDKLGQAAESCSKTPRSEERSQLEPRSVRDQSAGKEAVASENNGKEFSDGIQQFDANAGEDTQENSDPNSMNQEPWSGAQAESSQFKVLDDGVWDSSPLAEPPLQCEELAPAVPNNAKRANVDLLDIDEDAAQVQPADTETEQEISWPSRKGGSPSDNDTGLHAVGWPQFLTRSVRGDEHREGRSPRRSPQKSLSRIEQGSRDSTPYDAHPTYSFKPRHSKSNANGQVSHRNDDVQLGQTSGRSAGSTNRPKAVPTERAGLEFAPRFSVTTVPEPARSRRTSLTRLNARSKSHYRRGELDDASLMSTNMIREKERDLSGRLQKLDKAVPSAQVFAKDDQPQARCTPLCETRKGSNSQFSTVEPTHLWTRKWGSEVYPEESASQVIVSSTTSEASTRNDHHDAQPYTIRLGSREPQPLSPKATARKATDLFTGNRRVEGNEEPRTSGALLPQSKRSRASRHSSDRTYHRSQEREDTFSSSHRDHQSSRSTASDGNRASSRVYSASKEPADDVDKSDASSSRRTDTTFDRTGS
ncbi:MAG: hypothetical protein Q9162_005412 [Coniocarpon cinnabarinum]